MNNIKIPDMSGIFATLSQKLGNYGCPITSFRFRNKFKALFYGNFLSTF